MTLRHVFHSKHECDLQIRMDCFLINPSLFWPRSNIIFIWYHWSLYSGFPIKLQSHRKGLAALKVCHGIWQMWPYSTSIQWIGEGRMGSTAFPILLVHELNAPTTQGDIVYRGINIQGIFYIIQLGNPYHRSKYIYQYQVFIPIGAEVANQRGIYNKWLVYISVATEAQVPKARHVGLRSFIIAWQTNELFSRRYTSEIDL